MSRDEDVAEVAAIIEGMARVEAANAEQRYQTPDGRFPSCKNRLGTMTCERCGNDVSATRGQACPAVSADKRWDVRYENE